MTDTPNTTQGKGAVDWSRPIEAVHEDGRVMPMAVRGTPNPYGPVETTMSPDPKVTNEFWYKDGRDYCITRSAWRIRNIPEHPTPTQYAPELVERMVALCRHAAVSASGHTQEEARSILSDLPQEVDPDEAYAEQLILEMGWAGEAEIGEAAVRRLVAQAYAAGRQLQQGDTA